MNDLSLYSLVDNTFLSQSTRSKLTKVLLKKHYEVDVIDTIKNQVSQEDNRDVQKGKTLIRHIQFSQVTELAKKLEAKLSLFETSSNGYKSHITTYELMKTLLIDPYHMNSYFVTNSRHQVNKNGTFATLPGNMTHSITPSMIVPKWANDSCFCDSTLVAMFLSNTSSDSLLFSHYYPVQYGTDVRYTDDTNARWLCESFGCNPYFDVDSDALEFFYNATSFVSSAMNKENFGEIGVGRLRNTDVYDNTFLKMKQHLVDLIVMLRTPHPVTSKKDPATGKVVLLLDIKGKLEKRIKMKDLVQSIWLLCTEEYGGDLDKIGTQSDPGQFVENIVSILHGQMMYYPLIYTEMKIRILNHGSIGTLETFFYKQDIVHDSSLGLKAIEDFFTVENAIKYSYGLETFTEKMSNINDDIAFRLFSLNTKKFAEFGINNPDDLKGLNLEMMDRSMIISPRRILMVKLQKEYGSVNIGSSRILLYDENKKFITRVSIPMMAGVFEYRVSSIICRLAASDLSNSGHYILYFSYMISQKPTTKYIWCMYDDTATDIVVVDIDSQRAQLEKTGYILLLEQITQ